MRINKFIAQSGYCSRRKADELIKYSKVCVNGTILLDLSYQVNDGDIVEVEGKKIKKKKKKFILLSINLLDILQQLRINSLIKKLLI